MRAATCSTPNVSRATRAARMLELSPLLTAAKAYASRMPAAMRVSRSKPMPVTVWPSNEVPRRRNDEASESMMATSWPLRPRVRARVEPTRPHPMMTKCTDATLHRDAAPDPAARARCPAGERKRTAYGPGLPLVALDSAVSQCPGSVIQWRRARYRFALQAPPSRSRDAQRQARGDPPPEAAGATDLRERRALVRGLRARRDPAHAGSGRRCLRR